MTCCRAAVAGDFQISVVFFAPSIAEVGYFVYHCGWWFLPACFERYSNPMSEADKYFRPRHCGALGVPECSSPPDRGYRSLDPLFYFALWVVE